MPAQSRGRKGAAFLDGGILDSRMECKDGFAAVRCSIRTGPGIARQWGVALKISRFRSPVPGAPGTTGLALCGGRVTRAFFAVGVLAALDEILGRPLANSLPAYGRARPART